jgi:hypothetical protein
MRQKSLWDTEEEETRAEMWKRLSEQSRGEIVGLLVRLLVQSVVERAGTEAQKEYEPMSSAKVQKAHLERLTRILWTAIQFVDM